MNIFPDVKPFKLDDKLPPFIWVYHKLGNHWTEFKRNGFFPDHSPNFEQPPGYSTMTWMSLGYTHWYPSDRQLPPDAETIRKSILTELHTRCARLEEAFNAAVRERDVARKTLSEIRDLLNNTSPASTSKNT